MADRFDIPGARVSVEQITEADIKEAMMGSQGDPSYAEQFGISSAPLGSPGYQEPSPAELEQKAALAFEIAKAEAVAAREANRKPDPFNTPEELEHWKKLYGESENEKGALRKSYQEIQEAFNGLMAQYQDLQYSAPQAPPQQPQWQPGPQAPPPMQAGPLPGYAPPQHYPDPFEGISDDDVIQGRQFKQFTQRVIEPAFQALLHQNQAALQRTAYLESQMLKQAKLNAGITPMEELRLMGKHPWLKSLPEANRLAALAGMRAQEAANAPPSVVAAQPPIVTETQNRILNKVTYVEGAQPQVNTDNSEAAIEAAKLRDYAKAMAAPSDTGERAAMLRAWAAKYGVKAIGYQPSDLAH